MRLFTRVSTTVAAAIERAVGAMENHDAVVEATIRDIRRASAEARARLNRVRSDSARMRAKIDALGETARRWEDRAVGRSGAPDATGAIDDATALECLRRRRECETQIEQLRGSLEQHESLERRLTANIERIDARLGELTRQRQVMRTRQATAEALRSARSVSEAASFEDIDETLERWDAQISEAELAIDPDPLEPEDALDRAFLAEEERASLADELAALKRNRGVQS